MKRGPVDPVRELMHRHQPWCAAAVDPLEIAAGLEAHGITDRTAAGYRHRDVFSLAEELFVRVPREPSVPGARRTRATALCRPGLRPLTVLVHLLPGLLCAAGLAACRVLGADPARSLSLQAATFALAGVAAGLAVRTGPLRRGGAAGGPGWAGAWTCLLLAFAGCGPQLRDALLRPGTRPDAAALLPMQPGGSTGLPDVATAAAFLGLALAVAPAAWWAGRFSRLARERLARAGTLTEFRCQARTLLAGTFAGFTVLLLALLAAACTALAPGVAPDGMVLGAAAVLGLLLFTARLLIAHGARSAAAVGLGALCVIEAAGLGIAAAARWRGQGAAAGLLRTVARIADPELLQVAAGSVATAALIVSAFAVLGRAGTYCFAESAADLAVPPDQEKH